MRMVCSSTQDPLIHRTTGENEPGLRQCEKMKNRLKLVKAEVNLQLYKNLIKLKLGTESIESQARNIVYERINRENGRFS